VHHIPDLSNSGSHAVSDWHARGAAHLRVQRIYGGKRAIMLKVAGREL